MRFPILVLAASLAASLPLPAQNVRDNQNLGASDAPYIASSGDLSILVTNDDADNSINVLLSDGRGVDWSAPLRIDDGTGLGNAELYSKSNPCRIHGSTVYVSWETDKSGTGPIEVAFNRSLDGGLTWAGETIIDRGVTTGTGTADYRMGSTDGGQVYFMLSSDNGNEEIWFNASHDGGATFLGPVQITDGTGDVDDIDMAWNGMTVHLVWEDNRNGTDDVWYQRSDDGGLTWLPADVQLSTGGFDADFDVNIEVDGSTVIVAWEEEHSDATNEEIRVNVSLDGGLTWTGDFKVGSNDPTLGEDVDELELEIANGRAVLAWEDNRTGADEVYASVSLDGGLTWSPEVQISTAGGGFPWIVDTSASTLADTWLGVIYSANGFPDTTVLAVSKDDGASWMPVTVAATVGDDDFGIAAYDATYNNFLAAWLADDNGSNELYVGGFRPQTLTPVGTFTAGSSVNFAISDFPADDAGMAFGVLVSAGSGSFLLPDGRETGLMNDAILNSSIAFIQSGFLAGSVSAAGDGTTPPVTFPGNIAPGTMLHCVAVSFTSPQNLGSITDVVIETVQ